MLPPGAHLGPYEIVSLIGSGGMGEVYRARDPRLNRDVAIKVAEERFAGRSLVEAQAIAALNHPNICTVHDVGPNYLVMELLEGQTLAERIAEGPMRVAHAVDVACQIASAIEEAHRKGVLHRDLKPGNIMLSHRRGSSDSLNVKVLDFGLAKLITGDPEVTRTVAGTVLGTPAYMAPEQAEGKPLDERTDVFSFGAITYEMLSGRRAFAGPSVMDVMNAVLRMDPAAFQVSPALDRIVRRCLEKDPARRFQTMAEVRAAFKNAHNAVSPNSTNAPPSIAVLPFANMSRDPDDEYFSDGLAEEIVNLLAHVAGLKVTARTSSFAFRGKEQDIRSIAEALGVGSILEGSVRRAGSRIRVTAQLINAEDGYHLWSERYDRELTDVFAIQDEIAQAISVALQRTLVAKPARHTPFFPAYEALLKARHHLRTYAPETFARARDYCEQAIALDPTYAAPHALLGFIHLQSTTHTGRPLPAVAGAIRREAQRALELDPLEADPHFLLGAVAAAHDYDWEEAERELQIALASPSAPAEAHWAHACVLSTFGRFEESTAEMRRTVELDPLHVNWRGVLMAHLVCEGRYEEALHEGRRALDVAQDQIHPHLAMAEAHLAMGNIDDAVASAERAHRNLPQQSMGTGFLAATLMRRGDADRATTLLREMGDTPTPLWGRAWYHLLCSEVAEAARWYEKMIDAREIFAPVYATSLYTTELRASPYWAKLARMMNLTDLPA